MRWRVVQWLGGVLVVAAAVAAGGFVATRAAAPAAPPDEINRGQHSGLQLPRFVSLKSDHVNVRGGPSRDHQVTWVFTRASLPVEIIAEFDTWRRIRDVDGSEGWIYHSLLSGRRTAMVAPWSGETTVAVRTGPAGDARITAHLQPGVVGSVRACHPGWCRISGQGFDGWIEQDRLWGVYPKETIE